MVSTLSKPLGSIERQLTSCANDPDWQRVWLAIRSEAWHTLVVIPADPTISSLEVVHGLAAVAWLQCSTSIVVADLRSVTLPAVDAVHEEMRHRAAQGDQVMMAIRAIDESPTTLPIARVADKAVLCVGLGTSSGRRARETVRQVGRQKFLGTVLVRPTE